MIVTTFLLAMACAAAPGQGARDRLATTDARGEVANIIAAYGGLAALQRLRIVRQEGTVTSLMRGGGEGRLLRLFARPASLRVEIAYPDTPPEVRVIHGAYGDRDGREVTGTPSHAAMVLQAARLALPLALHDGGGAVRDHGEVERGGKRVRVLSLPLPQRMELTIEVDPRTHLIVRSVGSMTVQGDRIEFATEYGDFRWVNGALFAFHEENYARGYHTGTTKLSRVEVLSKVPAGAFDEPL